MVDSTAEDRLWSLVQWQPYVDANDLLLAINAAAQRRPADFRTRVLLRDSYKALRGRWGETRVRASLTQTAAAELDAILHEDLGDRGFPTLERRLVEPLDPETLLGFLREVGASSREPMNLFVGGSSALILAGHLRRNTNDVDIVDELPPALRNNHELLQRLVARYDLQLTHFQSHYLPAGWRNRVHSLDRFGNTQVFLVDLHDIFVGKLFSKRDKDFVDLRALMSAVDREVLAERIRYHAAPLADDPRLRDVAEHNWYVLFGEPLPAIAKQ